jgi:ABC-2 type transport system permease protein
MRIIDLAFKDLSQIFRDKKSLLFLVAMPVFFTLFMGFAYKSGTNGAASNDNRIPLGWVNNDPNGLLSGQLFELLAHSDSVKLVELTSEGVNDSVRKGEVAGALVVPAGFSEQLAGSAVSDQSNGGPRQLTLVADLNSTQGQSLFQLLRTPVTQAMSSVEIAYLSVEAVGKPGDAAEFEQAFTAAAQAWMKTDSAALVKVEMAVAEPEKAWYGDNPYNQSSPGILVMFAIFGLVTSGQILVQERKTRTLQRMISTSMHAWQIVAGHTLAMFAVVFIQEVLLVVFGQIVLGVNYMREPLGILIVSISLGLWIAAMGLLIGVLVKNDSQVVLFSLMAMFIFSAMGGTWFPLESSSGAFAAIGKLLPSAWAMDGFQNMLIRGLGLRSTLLPAAVLLGYALLFFSVAVWRFRKIEL